MGGSKVLLALAAIMIAGLGAVADAAELSKSYHYVGVDPQFYILAPFEATELSFYDKDDNLLLEQLLPAGSVVQYAAADLGLSGLCYVRITGSKIISCLVNERPGPSGEVGITEAQSRLYRCYMFGKGEFNNPHDDYIRLYAPRATTLHFYDQDRAEIAVIEMGAGEIREINALDDLGVDRPYGLIIRGTRFFAISLYDAPGWTTLFIPQGISL